LRFKIRSAKSCVVVIQTFPTIGNRTSTTGPGDLSFSIAKSFPLGLTGKAKAQ
jgi:hypothetical protein